MNLCGATQDALLEALQRGEAASAIPPELREHVSGCSECRLAEHELRAMISAARTAMMEPLPADVEQRTLARLRDPIAAAAAKPRRGLWPRLGIASAAAAALALAVVAVSRLGQPEATPPRLLAGVVEVVGSGPMSAGSTLHAHDVLRVGPDGRATLAANGARLTLTDGAQVALGEADTTVGLRHGTIVASVTPRPSGASPFTVRAGEVTITVIGTLFRVASTTAGVAVTVAHGTVSLQAGSARLLLHEGESATVSVAGALQKSRATPTEIDRLLADDPDAPAADPAPALSPGQPQPPTATPPEPGSKPDDADRPEHTVRAPSAKTPSPARAPNGMDPHLKANDCAAAEGVLDKDAKAEGALRVSECYQAQGRGDDAVRILLATGRRLGSTPGGQEALYAAGRLAQRRRAYATAKHAFDEYLRVAPRGPLAPEALFHSCTSLVELGQFAEAARCAADYQQRFAQARQVKDAMLLEANMQREHLGGCSRAIHLYEQYLSQSSTRTDEVRRWRDACAAQIRSP